MNSWVAGTFSENSSFCLTLTGCFNPPNTTSLYSPYDYAFSQQDHQEGSAEINNHLSVCLSGGRLTVTSRHSPGSLFPVGETVVQYTATDAAGNSRTCNLTVTVQGIRAPLHLSDVPAPQGTLSLFFLSCVMRMKYTVNKTKHQCQCPFAVPEFFSFIVQSCMIVIRH